MSSFLSYPEPSPAAQHLYDDDLADAGYVMNCSRLWAYQPAAHDAIADTLGSISAEHDLTIRQRGILIAACASTLGDSYCSLAWGRKLAKAADPQTAAGVLGGDDDGLTPAEKAMAAWARKVAGDPNGTAEADVQDLRDAGWRDDQIFAITVFVALRIAFSTVNDALGVRPDAAFRSTAPQAVLDAVTYGRPISEEPLQTVIPT
jgi:alkylhydroperoxidase family enzyme